MVLVPVWPMGLAPTRAMVSMWVMARPVSALQPPAAGQRARVTERQALCLASGPLVLLPLVRLRLELALRVEPELRAHRAAVAS